MQTSARAITLRRSSLWLVAAAVATTGVLMLAVLATNANAQSDSAATPSTESETTSEGNCVYHGKKLRGHHHAHGHFKGADQIAELIGVDVETLREALESGQSLAEVAESNGVNAETLVQSITEAFEARLDAFVENGRIDTETADDIRAKVAERAQALVDKTIPEHVANDTADPDNTSDYECVGRGNWRHHKDGRRHLEDGRHLKFKRADAA